MDAIEMLKKEHKGAKGVMEEIIKSSGAKRKKLFETLKGELGIHDRVEEQIFYPAVQNNAKAAGFPAADKKAHEAVEAALAALEKLPIEDKNWINSFKAMQTALLAHVADEETRLFVTIRTILSNDELMQLGDKMKAGKEKLVKVMASV
jgi:iron-sulfur cluster repair protein YtfE (RIC family)